MSQEILYDVQQHVATITLNRPDSFNSFNNAMSFAFIDALKQAAKDPEVRAVVLTGAGDRAFCSGQDLKDRAGAEAGSWSLGESVRTRYNPIVRLITQTEKPFICRLNGVAAGAGAGLALACDYVVAADTSYLLFAFVNIGLVPDTGSSFTLPAIVGKRKAFELLAMGDKILAAQALALGLVNEVVPATELDAATLRVATRFAEKAPKAVGLIKRMVNRAADGAALEDMLEMEMHNQEIVGRTQDFFEGVMAFAQKRKPEFKGL